MQGGGRFKAKKCRRLREHLRGGLVLVGGGRKKDLPEREMDKQE